MRIPYRQRAKILEDDDLVKLEQKIQEQADEHGALETISAVTDTDANGFIVTVTWLEETS